MRIDKNYFLLLTINFGLCQMYETLTVTTSDNTELIISVSWYPYDKNLYSEQKIRYEDQNS